MEKHNLNDFKGGWFIGNFNPTICGTWYFETGLKKYSAGDVDKAHYHKIAKEYTLVVSGEVEMNGIKYIEDDIIIVEPKEIVKFKALTDAKIMVVKIPSLKDDKYIVEE